MLLRRRNVKDFHFSVVGITEYGINQHISQFCLVGSVIELFTLCIYDRKVVRVTLRVAPIKKPHSFFRVRF